MISQREERTGTNNDDVDPRFDRLLGSRVIEGYGTSWVCVEVGRYFVSSLESFMLINLSRFKY